MLTENFFFLTKNFFLCYTSCGLPQQLERTLIQKKNSVNLEEEKFKSWNKSGRQLKNASKD